jgi:hypothetical protein
VERPVNNLIYRRELFWEVDPARIEQILRESDDWAIVRVFEYGEIEDILNAIELYGEQKIKEVLSTEKLKPVAYVMAYLFLGIDPHNRYASQRNG